MFRKFFWLLVFLAGYFWVVLSEKEDHVVSQAKTIGVLVHKKWNSLGLKWHIHTFKCPKKKTSRASNFSSELF